MNYLSFLSSMEQVGCHTQAPRSYYIPYDSASHALQAGSRRDSSQFTLLNGIWDFAYLGSVEDLPDDFWETGDMALTDKIPVPSCWQCEGYGHHQYTNVSYPIPFDPPHVPDENPCGIYRRGIQVDDIRGCRFYLNLEGADSCSYVWVNRHFVGYDQVSHANTEFDISDYLKAGENTVTILVVQWCVGTYFEDQDKFRYSGIFRDIYLLKRPEGHIGDVHWFTSIDLEQNTGTLHLTKKEFDGEPEVFLYDRGCRLAASGIWTQDTMELTVGNAVFWNVEQPYLYTLILKAGKEYLPFRVGFREWRQEGGQICLNGRAVKLYGVNHHDSHPVKGASVSLADQKMDLLLMKEHHINAIRTSHYPKSPEFYELCDELGFYVMAEADVECHGVVDLYGMNGNANYNMIADDPTYETVILDRVHRMISSQRLFTCIFSWSMGNESGYGCNFEKALHMAKRLDPTRLLHYEGLCRDKETVEAVMAHSDLYSRMYWGREQMEAFLDRVQDAPLMLCEYAHAMGNGPGDLKMYEQLMERYPNFIGAFVWEWCDHAMLLPGSTPASPLYGYGGDFQDYPHFSNFCMDGLVYPDRRPHTGLKEYQSIFLPVTMIGYGQGALTLRSRLDFMTAGEAFTGYYRYSLDGLPQPWQRLSLEQLEAGGVRRFAVEPLETEGKLATLEWTVMPVRQAEEPGKDGTYGIQQWIISEPSPEYRVCTQVTGIPSVREQGHLIHITGHRFHYIYDKHLAGFTSLIHCNQEWLNGDTSWDIWRAPIDNDRKIQRLWREAGFDRVVRKHDCTAIEYRPGELVITTSFGLTATYLQRIASVTARWTIGAGGQLTCGLHLEKDPIFPDLPRFGICFPLKKEASSFSYLGYGPWESYCDKHYAGYLGCFSSDAVKNFEPYIKPQENGSHYHTSWVNVHMDSGHMQIRAENTCSFSLLPYSTRQLGTAMHLHELPQPDGCYLCLDYKQNGIGSNSCGPALLPEHCFSETSFDWGFQIEFC